MADITNDLTPKERNRTINVRARVREWIRKYYGERCANFEEGCACCEAWKCFDYLFTDELHFDGKTSQWYYPKKDMKS